MSTDANDAQGSDAGGPREETNAAERAREILGAAPPADLAGLLALFKESHRLAQRLEESDDEELAARLRERVRAADMEKARRLLDGESEATANVLKLTGRLKQLGEKELARKLEDKVRVALINEARAILRGTERTPGEILTLAKGLGKLDEFNLGWRVLDRARSHPNFGKYDKSVQIIQMRALFTYKDVTQPLDRRLNEALDFLENHAGIPETVSEQRLDAAAITDQETLGLAGAIYKRKWELDKQERHLRASRDLYKRGYEQRTKEKPWGDQGYTSINYAYVLDLLAHLDTREAARLRETARTVRGEIVGETFNMLKADPTLADAWFFYSTIGEAYLGLGDFGKAHEWLVTRPEAEFVRPPDWEFETTARQLASLVRIQSPAGTDFKQTPAWTAFREFLGASAAGKGGVSAEAVRQLPEGKVGLALSGGGFRASLFHIGVLARLAELDMLRRVEVLSCVSGGSIVGAHYYLEIRKLLEEKPDSEIGKQDYINIVARLETEFLAGVQTNIRTNVITDRQKVRRMLKRDYSRTTRLGELYEEQLYSRVKDGHAGERYMHELVVKPLLDHERPWEDFKPRNHNWRREAKVPILIINAATLNTGHNWQFTATYMGEAPATIHSEVDSVYRLRRKYYAEAPDSTARPQLIRLGEAVAASSCVPLLFEPVVLEDIYEARQGGERISVKLVDGGVCDNQGVAGLLEQDCTVLLVSDGSGHLGAVDRPSDEALNVGLRTNDVLQARIRGTQYRELDARRTGSMLNGMMFVHLKKDLDNPPVNWKGCPPESRLDQLDERHVLTKYEVSKEVQRRLAALRTDLDTFSDQESYALMLSAYRMTEYEFKRQLPEMGEQKTERNGNKVKRENWKFLDPRLVRAMKEEGEGQDTLNTMLDAGGGLFMKIWNLEDDLKARKRRWKRLAIALAVLLAVVLALVAAAAVFALWSFFFRPGAGLIPPQALTWVGVAVLALSLSALLAFGLAALFLFLKLRGTPEPLDALAHSAVGGLLLTVGWPMAKLHMRKYESRYLERGKLDRLPPEPA